MAFLGINMHPLAATKLVAIKSHTPFFQSIQGVILPYPNIISRMETSASLTYNDVPWNYPLQQQIMCISRLERICPCLIINDKGLGSNGPQGIINT